MSKTIKGITSKVVSRQLLEKAQEYARSVFLPGLNESVTQFHAVNHSKKRLKEAGFEEIKERDEWNIKAGHGYYLTRNNSTIVAFNVPQHQQQQKQSLFKIIGCHTDSPVLKVAPFSALKDRHGFNQLNVQTYGGGLWHTWFDRDLTLAGKIIVAEGKKIVSKYWQAKNNKPLLKIANLAIHLTDKSGTFEPNKESHLKPILSSAIVDQIWSEEGDSEDEALYKQHHRSLLNLIAGDLKLNPLQIVDFELNVIDSQPAQLIGMNEEFVSGPRLDNLASSLIALDSLIDQKNSNQAGVNMIMLFDHEEVGSQSAQGADSNMAAEITQRIHESINGNKGQMQDYYRAIRNSFMLSADMAHGMHPNYSEKHHPQHAPRIHEGIVIKTNANQRYMTDSVGTSIVRQIAKLSTEDGGIPIQDFIVKNDSACGSTIGPMMAAKAGLKTVDIGAPMLGMHSIRETCGVIDLLHYRRLFSTFFGQYSNIVEHSDLLNE